MIDKLMVDDPFKDGFSRRNHPAIGVPLFMETLLLCSLNLGIGDDHHKKRSHAQSERRKKKSVDDG